MHRLLASSSLLLLAAAPACFNPDPTPIDTDTGTDTDPAPTSGPGETADDTAGDEACRDGTMNGEETDVDCGGSSCEPCSDGQGCGEASDCASMLCQEGTCVGSSCGDGVMNGEETDVDCGGPSCNPCDDGQGCSEGSDCTSSVCTDGTCQAPACGDGVVDPKTEACDDAGDSEACNADCTAAACGDGLVNMAASEECDDMVETAACDTDCTVVECGDGQPNAVAGEVCDDGEGSATCDADCTEVTCGDGLANEFAGEACDDGAPTETCDADCTAAMCGDGLVNDLAGETCDDGDGIDDNLCSNACTFNTCVFDTGLLPLTVHPGNFFGDFDFDGSCNLIVSGGFDNTLLRVDGATGAVSTLVASFTGSSSVNGVAHRDSDGLTYVATDGSPILWSVTPAGVVDQILAMPTTVNAIAIAPPGFGAYADRIIGVAVDGSVYAFDPGPGSTAVVGSVGGALLSDLDFDIVTGTLYLAAQGTNQVLTMTPAGATAMVAQGFSGLDGVAVDPAGIVYAADSNNQSITAIDIGGGGQVVVANPQLDGGYYVTGLLVDGAGTLLMKVGNPIGGADIAFYSP